MKDFIESFGGGILFAGILGLVYLLPLWWLVQFAKRERKDWRIALVAGLFFSWVLALLILLIVPKLSDEDFARLNRPKVRKEWNDGDGLSSTAIVLITLGVMSAGALGVMALVAWVM